MLKYNNRGQMMMIGIMILIMSILIFVATMPAVQSVLQDSMACDSLNCAGYVDQDATGEGCSATNRSYLPSGNQNQLSCTIMDLILPFIILGVLIALITMLMSGRIVDPPQPQYGGYPGQY